MSCGFSIWVGILIEELGLKVTMIGVPIRHQSRDRVEKMNLACKVEQPP